MILVGGILSGGFYPGTVYICVHQVYMTKYTYLVNCNIVEIEEAMASNYTEINRTFAAHEACSFLAFWHLTPLWLRADLHRPVLFAIIFQC